MNLSEVCDVNIDLSEVCDVKINLSEICHITVYLTIIICGSNALESVRINKQLGKHYYSFCSD